MSGDSISVSTPGVSELVPSRYAVEVGDIEVLIISDGVLPITASTLATNVDPPELAGWLDDNFLPPDVLDWPLNIVVVRRGEHTILVDAGLGVEFPDFPKAGQMVATHLSFPSLCRVAVAGDSFRCVPTVWNY